MLRIFRALWGDLSTEEFKKFGILSAAMALVIGNYWMLRITKDPIFDLLVGFREWQPVAKILSLVVMVFVVLGYSKLVDLLSRKWLIYLLCSFYGLMFLIIGGLLARPDFLSVAPTSALYPMVSWIPGKALGWFAYLLLESYGSLLIGLFYSFIASVMSTDLAKKGYGLLSFVTQVGTVSGVLISMYYVKSIGFSGLYILGGLIVLAAPFVIKIYMSKFAQEIKATAESPKKGKTGFFEGVRLILTRPYIVGVFVVATFYEIISTIVEYQMNWVATGVYPHGSPDYVFFRGVQALGINGLALLFALVGTSFFMRRFGLRFCLIAFPTLIAVVVIFNLTAVQIGISNQFLMWGLLIATVAIKGFNYALNKPTSEVMYIPTSKDVKFKAKGWIDMFGNRFTKGTGSTVTKSFGYALPPLMLYGTIISLGIIGVWIAVAYMVGNKFNDLQETKTIIE